MGAFSKWLLQDEQKELFDILLALTLNIVFLGLLALLLWPLGRTLLALRLAKGYGLFWLVSYATVLLMIVCRRIFRMGLDSHFDAYVLSNLFVSGLLQAGWSAFAALTVHGFTGSTPGWPGVALLYFGGLLSCFIAFNIVSAFYGGSLYRRVNALLALVSYSLFSVWPASGRVLYGRLFDLF